MHRAKHQKKGGGHPSRDRLNQGMTLNRIYRKEDSEVKDSKLTTDMLYICIDGAKSQYESWIEQYED